MKKIKINGQLYIVNPCPCCGHQPQEELDYLHPSYNGFEVYKDFESEENFNYYNEKDNKYQKIFELHCLETEGGCGCSIKSDTLEGVINKWNNPVYNDRKSEKIHDCYFCGKKMNEENVRFAGIFWKYDENEDFCIYINKKEKNAKQCIKIECYEYLGGCGAKMIKDDRETLIKSWNRK